MEKCDQVSVNLTRRPWPVFISTAHWWPAGKQRKIIYQLSPPKVSHAGGCLTGVNEVKELKETPDFQWLGQWAQQKPGNPQTSTSAAYFLAYRAVESFGRQSDWFLWKSSYPPHSPPEHFEMKLSVCNGLSFTTRQMPDQTSNTQNISRNKTGWF